MQAIAMQTLAVFDAYAECAARIEGTMKGYKGLKGYPGMKELTDCNLIVYLIKNFAKLE